MPNWVAMVAAIPVNGKNSAKSKTPENRAASNKACRSILLTPDKLMQVVVSMKKKKNEKKQTTKNLLKILSLRRWIILIL